MGGLIKQIKVGVPAEIAFKKFVNDLNKWWPPEYTWSQDKLKTITMDGRRNGLCTEIGPNGFRCDWGTVIEFQDNTRIGLKWQIGAHREPVPNPAKASDITVDFNQEDGTTTITFEHFNFENHGDGADEYRAMMDSEHGWDYILNSFKSYCEER